jgi:glycolate oxidase FAD binding subunit
MAEMPGTIAEASDILRTAAADRRSLLFAGTGTKAGWGGIPAPADLTLGTGRLDRLVACNPGDMTVAVGAGMRLSQLQEVLGEHGQWFAVDPPTQGRGATLGGMLAAQESGPRRLRYGGMRDLVIGITVVLADGTVAHSGGHVIKNVAGYDLAKLFAGSLGVFGLIAELVLRVHPAPRASLTVSAQASAVQAGAATLRIRASDIEASALEWVGRPNGTPATGTLLARVQGTEAGVRARGTALVELLTEEGLSAERLEGDGEISRWAAHAEDLTGGPGSTVLAAGTRPTRLPDVVRALALVGDRYGVRARLVSSTALGLHTAVLSAGEPAEHVRAADDWRQAVLGLGGAITARERPPEVARNLDPLGPAPDTVTLLRRLKHELDPDGRCGRGRFGSWF